MSAESPVDDEDLDLERRYRAQLHYELSREPAAIEAAALLGRLLAASDEGRRALVHAAVADYDHYPRFPEESWQPSVDLGEYGDVLSALAAEDAQYLPLVCGFYGSLEAMARFLEIAHLRAVYLALSKIGAAKEDLASDGLAGRLRMAGSWQLWVLEIVETPRELLCEISSAYADALGRPFFLAAPGSEPCSPEDVPMVEVSPGDGAGTIAERLGEEERRMSERRLEGDGPIFLGSGTIWPDGSRTFERTDGETEYLPPGN